jgi:superfamily I DNA and/or RNA helicase
MSSLSVSYFLEAETYRFDMVIYDEASQIFPQDAIGAIFRAKQVIIAGDSKQLPPTNFFSASTSNDADFDYDEEEEEELNFDSILEEASNSLPNRSLLWHYRINCSLFANVISRTLSLQITFTI